MTAGFTPSTRQIVLIFRQNRKFPENTGNVINELRHSACDEHVGREPANDVGKLTV
jgi:hypothetical protein